MVQASKEVSPKLVCDKGAHVPRTPESGLCMTAMCTDLIRKMHRSFNQSTVRTLASSEKPCIHGELNREEGGDCHNDPPLGVIQGMNS